MLEDLRAILDGWEYEPGRISVRKIIGLDGCEKIQTRVDLGVLQFRMAGRPDGERPHGYDTILEHLEAQLEDHRARHGSDAGFKLSSDVCRELRHEAHLFYQRYLSEFVLEDFAAVERDAERNLRAFDFGRTYAATEQDREMLTEQRAYTVMMKTRSRVYQAMEAEDHQRAMELLEEGMREVEEAAIEAATLTNDPGTAELDVLVSLRSEIIEKMPPDSPTRLNWELRCAIADEDYEQAARIRDVLSRHGNKATDP